MQTKTEFRYFISYMVVTGDGQSFHNGEVTFARPITGMQEVKLVEQLLRDQHHAGTVLLISFTLLEGGSVIS